MSIIKERKDNSLRQPELQFSGVNRKIAEIRLVAKDQNLAHLFENCMLDGLKNIVAVDFNSEVPLTYIVTGDINAMWLRDSSYQMIPFVHLARDDRKLQQTILGTINQQARFILRDPYANAFLQHENETTPHRRDKTNMRPGIFERKWEPDSLSATIFLAYSYWKETGDESFARDKNWIDATKKIYDTLREQQRLTTNGQYAFQRPFAFSSKEKVVNKGMGSATQKVGLIHATHRPSDDATIYSFNIPQNLFAMQTLNQLAEMHETIVGDKDFAQSCRDFAKSIHDAVMEYGIVAHPKYGEIYAYEVDGRGNALLIDDANLPGLLSLPYFVKESGSLYQNTRQYILSEDNEYFLKGNEYSGIGSPHTGKENIWPLSIILRALTSTDDMEIQTCLDMIKATLGDRELLNESVAKNNSGKFTRQRFGMANSMFVELILSLQAQRPHLL